MLEVGCGHEGGVAPALSAAGYDVLAIDPKAPDGPLYRRVTLEELDDPGPFDAVVAGRVLHHVHPLDAALDKLAGLAPLLVLDEFAWNHMDEPTIDWYESQHRLLAAAGRRSARAARPRASGASGTATSTPYETLRAEVDARYEERDFEWRPYFYLWLRGPGERGAGGGLDRRRRDPADRLPLRGREERDGALAGGLSGSPGRASPRARGSAHRWQPAPA